jgi:Na+/H+-translocating membrane pyrophosphatase
MYDAITGYGLGLLHLPLRRVGVGIYTSAADVAADLSG